MKLDLTAEERIRIRRVRSQHEHVQSLQDKLVNMSPVSSPRMDGMPKGAGGKSYAESRTELQDRLQTERKRLKAYEQQARRVIDRMPPRMYRFCIAYYIDHASIEDIVRGTGGDLSERTCQRYKAMIDE